MDIDSFFIKALSIAELNVISNDALTQWNNDKKSAGMFEKDIILKEFEKDDYGYSKELYIHDDSNNDFGTYRKLTAYVENNKVYDLFISDADNNEVWTPNIERMKAELIGTQISSLDSQKNTATREVWIPTSMISDFKLRVTDLNKRASRLKCDPITYNITDQTDTIRIPDEQVGGYVEPGYCYEVTKVNITGTTPIIPGYQVVAKIDHDSELNTNIIMEFGNNKLPADFMHKDGDCDHCNIKRPRNKTYILLDKETGKLSQVGSSCLKDFTGHSNPENVCKIQEFMDDSMGELSEFGSSKSGYIKVEPFLNIVAECMLKYGYVSAKKAEEQCIMSTADEAMEVYKNDVDNKFIILDEAKTLSSKAVEYIKFLDRDKYDNYANNIISFIDNGMVKNKYYRMLASSIAFYNNEQYKLNKVESNKHKTFIGEIDTKITFNASLVNYTTTQNDFGIVYINKFNDSNGNDIMWFTNSASNLSPDIDYKITATIKSHKMYNDEPQTVITRPKFEATIVITGEEIEAAKCLSDVIGEHKGIIAVQQYNSYHENTYKNEPKIHEVYQYGMGNVAAYLGNDDIKDNIKKTLNGFNTHQILILAQTMQKTGFADNGSLKETKKFFKMNDSVVKKITDIYPVVKPVKTKSR